MSAPQKMCGSWQPLIFGSGFDEWLLKLSQNSDAGLILSHYLCIRLTLNWRVLQALVFIKSLGSAENKLKP